MSYKIIPEIWRLLIDTQNANTDGILWTNNGSPQKRNRGERQLCIGACPDGCVV